MDFLRLRFAAAALLAGGAASALSGASCGQGGNALAVLDAYLARAAARAPAYRADLRAGPSSATGGDRLPGWSPILGAFTYRARTYRELRPDERSELLRGPAFRAFLENLRRGAARVPLPASELLRPGPLVVLVLAQ